MKFTFFTLLFTTYFFGFAHDTLVAKNSNLGLIASTEMNVVYRGVRNPISIAVPHAKSFTVSGPGVSQENGSYYITPGQGNKITDDVFDELIKLKKGKEILIYNIEFKQLSERKILIHPIGTIQIQISD
jgi:hypothetical protein